MKILSWTVNGFSKLFESKYLLPVIGKVSPDVVCLQNTLLEKSVDTDLDSWYPHRIWAFGRSGSTLFSKVKPKHPIRNLMDSMHDRDTLVDHERRHDTESYGKYNYEKKGVNGLPPPFASEGRLVGADFYDFYLLSAYSDNVISRVKWDFLLGQYAKTLLQKKPVVVMGSFGLGESPMDLMSLGFIDTYAHFHNDYAWRSDYALVSSNLLSSVRRSDILHGINGGEPPVLLELDLPKEDTAQLLF